MRKSIRPKFKIGKFIDPLTDFGFKRIFGGNPTKDLLIDFLNELFKGRKVIIDITFNNNEVVGGVSKIRRTIFDLTCTAQNGEQFIIEVQRIKQKFFKDRAIFYASRLISNQAPQNGSWDYSLKEVYFIGIMDFVLEDSDKDKYLHWVSLSY
ncbi:MAG: Rpn family recombination-promoting nuclease/putative transposase, partial [Chitinophagaceae bacterium]